MRFLILTLIFYFSIQSHSSQQSEYLIKAESSFIQKFQTPLSKKTEIIRDNLMVISLSSSEVNEMRQEPAVSAVVKNMPLQLFKTPNDLGRKHWNLNNQGRNSRFFDINAPAAWDITTGSKNVIVAVIDTGAFIGHDDLSENLWENSSEVNGVIGVDDDGNGYVDDFFGFDFPKNSGILGDRDGHGTSVSGVIGAKGNNGYGAVGVNWEVSLMVLNIYPDDGEGQTDDAIKAIDYAVANGAKVINASWAGDPPEAGDSKEENDYKLLYEAIERAGRAGVTFVAASGNKRVNTDIKPRLPAAFDLDNIISVGSISQNGKSSRFSNYGKKTVDVFAPGNMIMSTTIDGGTDHFSGTSMAAPHITGIVALMLSVNDSLTIKEIKSALINTCVPTKFLKHKSVCKGYVDAHAALLEVTEK